MTILFRRKRNQPAQAAPDEFLSDAIPEHLLTRTSVEFRAGMTAMQYREYDTALEYLALAAAQTDEEHELAGLYQAYQGMAKLLSGDMTGINLCRRAAYFERHLVLVLAVLVQAELLCGKRERAVHALRSGFRMAPDHTLLLHLKSRMRYRRKPVFPRLPREHWLNFLAGKLRGLTTGCV